MKRLLWLLIVGLLSEDKSDAFTTDVIVNKKMLPSPPASPKPSAFLSVGTSTKSHVFLTSASLSTIMTSSRKILYRKTTKSAKSRASRPRPAIRTNPATRTTPPATAITPSTTTPNTIVTSTKNPIPATLTTPATTTKTPIVTNPTKTTTSIKTVFPTKTTTSTKVESLTKTITSAKNNIVATPTKTTKTSIVATSAKTKTSTKTLFPTKPTTPTKTPIVTIPTKITTSTKTTIVTTPTKTTTFAKPSIVTTPTKITTSTRTTIVTTPTKATTFTKTHTPAPPSTTLTPIVTLITTTSITTIDAASTPPFKPMTPTVDTNVPTIADSTAEAINRKTDSASFFTEKPSINSYFAEYETTDAATSSTGLFTSFYTKEIVLILTLLVAVALIVAGVIVVIRKCKFDGRNEISSRKNTNQNETVSYDYSTSRQSEFTAPPVSTIHADMEMQPRPMPSSNTTYPSLQPANTAIDMGKRVIFADRSYPKKDQQKPKCADKITASLSYFYSKS